MNQILLDKKAVAVALAPLRVAKSMPPEIYTSPEIFALERERILLRDWPAAEAGDPDRMLSGSAPQRPRSRAAR